MAERIGVGLLGATGVVGQQFVARLASHPWFRLTWLGASERSEGRPYRDCAAWRLPIPLPEDVGAMTVSGVVPGSAPRLVFSALDASVAGEVEAAFAAAGHLVVSNSKNHRMEPDVPLLIPEVNAGQLALVGHQRARRGWSGAIVTNPNCSTVILVMTLAPLRQFGLRAVSVTTLQALSGAGYPGVASLDAIGNVVPFIDGEERKIETETGKILGEVRGDTVVPHDAVVSAQATRVPVPNGHTMAVSVRLDARPSAMDIRRAFETFMGGPAVAGLPSAPARPVVYLDGDARPQPRLDVGTGDGMTVSVGRLRECPVLGWKYVALGDNVVRGAAGGAILNAELMRAEGMLT